MRLQTRVKEEASVNLHSNRLVNRLAYMAHETTVGVFDAKTHASRGGGFRSPSWFRPATKSSLTKLCERFASFERVRLWEKPLSTS